MPEPYWLSPRRFPTHRKPTRMAVLSQSWPVLALPSSFLQRSMGRERCKWKVSLLVVCGVLALVSKAQRERAGKVQKYGLIGLPDLKVSKGGFFTLPASVTMLVANNFCLVFKHEAWTPWMWYRLNHCIDISTHSLVISIAEGNANIFLSLYFTMANIELTLTLR